MDTSEEPFSWSEPSFKALRDFSLRNLNWSGRDIDQYLTQVQKRMQELKNKKKGTIDQYFKKEETFAQIQSVRIV